MAWLGALNLDIIPGLTLLLSVFVYGGLGRYFLYSLVYSITHAFVYYSLARA
jgi:hypothetical protein